MPRQQLRNLRRLRCHKAQPVPPVATQEPPHRPVAKPAAPIKDNQQPVADSIQFAHTCSRCLLNGQLVTLKTKLIHEWLAKRPR